MKIKKLLMDLLFFGSIYYTVITAALILIATLLMNNSEALIETKRFLLILLFSFIMGIGSAILRAGIMNRTAASLTHAACYVLGFLIFVSLVSADFTTSVIFTLVFAVIYIVITLIARCLLKIGVTDEKTASKSAAPNKTNRKKEKSTYTNQFLK